MSSMSVPDALESLSPSAIALTDHQLEQAHQSCQSIVDPVQQWQCYLNSMALLGFEQWLYHRANDLALNVTQSSMMDAAEVLPVIFQVMVNGFKVCLIPVESQPDEVEFPSVAISIPNLASHFYITVAIYEEQSQIAVHRFLRYDQLTTQLRSRQPDTDGFYILSTEAFEADLDRLLLYLRCSQPAAIPLPNIAPTAAFPPTPRINVRRWLQNELDAWAQQLAWVLLPPLSLENAMRLTARVVNQPTSQESFENVIKQLVRDGMSLPADARVAYQDLDLAGVPTRLYAIAGTLPPDPAPEWTLLLILGPRSQTPLPRQTQLQIGVADTLLIQQTLTQQDNYVYAKVIGTLAEHFWVTISAPHTEPIALPPFTMQPHA